MEKRRPPATKGEPKGETSSKQKKKTGVRTPSYGAASKEPREELNSLDTKPPGKEKKPPHPKKPDEASNSPLSKREGSGGVLGEGAYQMQGGFM